MALVLIKDTLGYLVYLEAQTKNSSSSASVKDQIQTLKTEFKFVSLFFKCIEVKVIEDEFLKEEVSKIEGVIRDVGEVIHSRYVEAVAANSGGDLNGNRLTCFLAKIQLKFRRLFFKCTFKEKNLNQDESLAGHWLTHILDKIELIKPQVDQSYHCILQVGTDLNLRKSDHFSQLIEYALENLKDLIHHSSFINVDVEVKNQIDALQRKLIFLRHSIQMIAKVRSKKWPLYDEIAGASVTAASFFFQCWINKTDTFKVPDLSRALNYPPHDHLELTSIYSILLRRQAKDWVANYIDFLVQRLGEVISRKTTPKQAKSLYEELKFLRSFLIKTPPQDAHHWILCERQIKHQMTVHVNKVARLVEDLYVGNMVKKAIHAQVLGRIKLTNIFFRMELVHEEASSVNLRDDHQFETLLGDMRLLRTYYFDRFNYRKADNFMRDVVLEAGSLVYSLSTNQITAEEMSSLLPDLLAKLKLVKADMRKIYPHATPPNFPKKGGKIGTAILLKDLTELLSSRVNVIARSVTNPSVRKFSKHWVENLHDELELLIPNLARSEAKCSEMGELKALEECIKNVTNEANYVMGTSFLNNHPLWCCMLKYSDIMEEVKVIKEEMVRMFGETFLTQDNTLTTGELDVGFVDETEKFIHQLVGGSKKLHVISIVGMGGLGKTTLISKLYNNPLVSEHFDCQAWSCVSQVFQKRELLLDILRQVDELTRDINQYTTDADLENMLRKSLKRRRYLIVMDDIWDIKAWDSLSGCFDDDSEGSRIVFTTRNKNVHTRNSTIYPLRYFNDDESFELLLKKLFPGERCPREEVENVKQIARLCKGLPLAVVVVAGLLTTKKRQEWKEVAECLSQQGDVQNLITKAMELSYNNLPDYLKPCFLYFGGFPEDKEIPVEKLMWLWVAEGFTHKNKAEEYLKDLMDRSLVTVAKRRSNGQIKTCRIHDVLLEYSLTKAKQERVLLLLDGKSSPLLRDHEKYRMCVYSKVNDVNKWPSKFNVCSLVHFAPTIHLDSISSYMSFNGRSFKSLNVLDLERLVVKDLSCGIEFLEELRLLSVRIKSDVIPESISKLSNLETFIVKGLKGEVAIPNCVWSMINLRHLHVDKRASLVWDERDVKDSVLVELETLSTPVLSWRYNSRDVICLLRNLLKLKCIFLEVDHNNYFPSLETLFQLESLKVLYYGYRKVSNGRFSFPLSLKQLSLSKFQLPWSHITTIAKLPNLEVLKLMLKAFGGEVWETKADEFQKLKYLKLEGLDIKQWNVANEEHFPLLEKLVVHRCKQLEIIPFSFKESPTLEVIEVKWSSLSAANSAKEIYDEQKVSGNEKFMVNIHSNR